MMTEPRPYRGIDANGSWVRGSLLTFGKRRFIIPPAVDDDGGRLSVALGRWIEVDSETVGQSTGLKDKNGTDGFASDIVQFFEKIYVISWNICNGCWYLKNTDKQEPDLAINNLLVGKIIGNIRQNPDLLKGAE